MNKKVGDIFVLLLLMVLSALDLYKVINMNGKMLVWWDTDWFNGVALGIWFLIGVLFQLLALRRICNWQVGVLVTIIYVCCPSVVKYVITPYVVGYLTMCFALAEDPCFQKTFKRDICYGMYLYAFPVQQLLIQVLMIRKQISVSPYVLIVITVGVVSAIAIIQSIFIEEKCFSKIFVK